MFSVEAIATLDTLPVAAPMPAGDAEAFTRLIQPLEHRLYWQAVALCRDESEAEDLVAETIEAAWKNLRTWNRTCRFSTWLYAILLHRSEKSRRRARARPISVSSLTSADAEKQAAAQENLPAAEASPADAALQHERAERLHRAVGALPEKHREVILLCYFGEATLPEMAAALHCSTGTIKSRLHYALGKLRHMKLILNLSQARRDS